MRRICHFSGQVNDPATAAGQRPHGKRDGISAGPARILPSCLFCSIQGLTLDLHTEMINSSDLKYIANYDQELDIEEI